MEKRQLDVRIPRDCKKNHELVFDGLGEHTTAGEVLQKFLVKILCTVKFVDVALLTIHLHLSGRKKPLRNQRDETMNCMLL